MRSKQTLASLLLLGVIASGCSSKGGDTRVASAPQGTPDVIERAPTDLTEGWQDNLRTAWKRWNPAGRYRLASPNDFRFSEAARQAMGNDRFVSYTTRPLIHWWGAYGAIVVDTTRSDQNRFGLVVFEVVEPDKLDDEAKLEPRWYVQGVDLSTTGLEQASGYRFVMTYEDDGSHRGCALKWNNAAGKYVCRYFTAPPN